MTSEEISQEFTIQNAYGIHARPAAKFVKTASRFASEVFVEKSGMRVSGKSIMGLLTIEGHHGSVLKVCAKGEDAQAALEALGELINRKFDEE